ncbi:MAG: hypothetical protein Q7J25_08495 [Vicinamibacterales bacterium]|nr:hypothetical protein [Vicinamibacterales bacterium]
MTALDCLTTARAAGPEFQRVINAFIDDFRRAAPEARLLLVDTPVTESGPLEGLIAGVVSALCRETGTETPESPAPFRIRRVFVPENYLSRA